MNAKEIIENGSAVLGLEFGSTRIKAVLTDRDGKVLAVGSHAWENSLVDGVWTYPFDEIVSGLQSCYADLKSVVRAQYDTGIPALSAMGISGMMHGILAFDKDGKLLAPFRTWRNTMTAKAAAELSAALKFNIPQRWTVAHLYQSVLNGEEYVKSVHHVNTLAGTVYEMLTGVFAVGVGEGSGIFPTSGIGYHGDRLHTAQRLFESHGFELPLSEVFPRVIPAKEIHPMTEKGAKLLDPSGELQSGTPLCPPEGDAQTGMAATNSIAAGTGNVSAGTSYFSMLVLEKPMSSYFEEIDIVATPQGNDVAMIHCNNGASEIDRWAKLFGEAMELAGAKVDTAFLYNMLYKAADKARCGDKTTAFNFLSDEPVVHTSNAAPTVISKAGEHATLGEFFRSLVYSSMGALKLGMDILAGEGYSPKKVVGHGGIFKSGGTAAQILSDAFNCPVKIYSTAGEGGAWGMALLAAYSVSDEDSLVAFLDKVFADSSSSEYAPDKAGQADFAEFMKGYTAKLGLYR